MAKTKKPPIPVRRAVAIVGRPNVGKSTLLNRIVGRREAIVEERPGVTRDRKEVEAEWQGDTFAIIDTGGWLPGGNALDEKVSRQAERAVEESAVVLLVVDATIGVVEEDSRVAEWLRRSGRPVLVVANKVDDAKREAAIWDFVSLGLGTPFPVSALHGKGTGDLLDRIVELLPATIDDDARSGAEKRAARTAATDPTSGSVDHPSGDDELGDHDSDDEEDDLDGSAGEIEPSMRRFSDADKVFSVAIVGRPNVGKSTLFNRLIGEDRAIVHDMPGTTRDSVDTVVETPDGPIRFVDTAGMRRKSRIDENTEYYSMVRALESINEADIAMLVIDATASVTHQDQRLAERIDVAGCPVVVLLNKWELLDAEQRIEVMYQVGRKLHFVGDSPVLKISALTGKGIHKLMPILTGTIDDYHKRVPTSKVNEVLRAAQQAQPAPHGARVLYALQGAVDPPTFTLFVNRPVPPAYLRYLERKIRDDLKFGSTPLKLRVRHRAD